MCIIGEKEIEANEVAVRKQSVGDQGSQSVDNFIKFILAEVDNA